MLHHLKSLVLTLQDLLKKEITQKFFLIERCKFLENQLKPQISQKSASTQTSEGFIDSRLNHNSISDYCKTYFHQDIQNISIKTQIYNKFYIPEEPGSGDSSFRSMGSAMVVGATRRSR